LGARPPSGVTIGALADGKSDDMEFLCFNVVDEASAILISQVIRAIKAIRAARERAAPRAAFSLAIKPEFRSATSDILNNIPYA
jgi:hypothetical protein